MKTPIVDFVKKYVSENVCRLHMPGHKGVNFLGMEAMDLTEVQGADVLYDADGIIAQSQQNATDLFGSGQTLYCCEGSSQVIRAMLYLAVMGDGKGEKTGQRPLILAARNAHRAFISAAALLDADVVWMYPERFESVVSCVITPEQLSRALDDQARPVAAVYLTSPDYLGNLCDVRGLSRVCRERGTYLIVDNAHGAYLHFLSEPAHPLDLGAHMCCDSGHKTLPVLTGGAYLHLAKDAPDVWKQNAARALALFCSSSPSYLILQSLDLANRYLAGGYPARLAACAERVGRLGEALYGMGYCLVGSEAIKLTIAPKSYGYTGRELYEQLYRAGVVCEFADEDHLVMMFTPENGQEDYARVLHTLGALARRTPIERRPPQPTKTVQAMSLRQALFSDSETLPIGACIGRVLSCENVSCPPAVPIVACGEIVDDGACALLRYYGVTHCQVVKK